MSNRLWSSPPKKSLWDESKPEAMEPTADEQDSKTVTESENADTASVFTQSTIAQSTMTTDAPQRKGLSAFFKRDGTNKTSSDNRALIDGQGDEQSSKKPSKLSKLFKPYEQTPEDIAIMEQMKARIGSREEAIRMGGAQPAGYKGINGSSGLATWTAM